MDLESLAKIKIKKIFILISSCGKRGSPTVLFSLKSITDAEIPSTNPEWKARNY